jgi:hypothetical protein
MSEHETNLLNFCSDKEQLRSNKGGKKVSFPFLRFETSENTFN